MAAANQKLWTRNPQQGETIRIVDLRFLAFPPAGAALSDAVVKRFRERYPGHFIIVLEAGRNLLKKKSGCRGAFLRQQFNISR